MSYEDDRQLAPVPPHSGYYSSTAIADYTIRHLQEHASKHPDKAFFAYVSFIAPHFPLHAPASDVDRYRDKYVVGWDVVRQRRWERMRQRGLGAKSLSPVERDCGPPYAFPDDVKKLGSGESILPLPWSDLSDAQRKFQADKMAVHAAMIDRMDQEIGRIVAQIRAMGAVENTLILVLSDNGASAEIMVRGDGHNTHAVAGSSETFLCLGPGWSGVANTPFRRHKTWVHEGGISTPLVVHWPAGIVARGELRHAPGHVIDVVPTVLELAGAKSPSATDAVPEMPGRSLVPAFARDVSLERRSIWFLHEGNRALRVGDWKIVASGMDGEWELYNLANDRAESQNLAGIMPEKLREMAEQWAFESGVYKKWADKDRPPRKKKEKKT